MDELFYWPARAMVDALRKRDISSKEIVQAHLARINEVNPLINAVVLVDAEGCVGNG